MLLLNRFGLALSGRFTKPCTRSRAPFAGSLIQQSGDLDAAYSRARLEPDEDKRVEILKELRLRRFSPSEIARYEIRGL